MWKSLVVMIFVSGCTLNVDAGSADGAKQEKFSKVVNQTGATVVLVNPDDWAFEDNFWGTECAQAILDDYSFDIKDGTLTIKASDDARHPDCRVKTRSEDVEDVQCDGDGDLDHEGDVSGVSTIRVTGNGSVDLDRLETSSLDLYAGGNGTVAIADLQADTLVLTIAGNGSVELGGDVADGDFSVTGNGALQAHDLVLQTLTISVTGDGDADVTVEDSVDGETSGAGTIDLYGGADGAIDATGSGTVVVH